MTASLHSMLETEGQQALFCRQVEGLLASGIMKNCKVIVRLVGRDSVCIFAMCAAIGDNKARAIVSLTQGGPLCNIPDEDALCGLQIRAAAMLLLWIATHCQYRVWAAVQSQHDEFRAVMASKTAQSLHPTTGNA